MGKVNEDLQRERNKCTFNVKELTNIIDGGPDKTLERIQREEIIFSAKELYASIPEAYLDVQGKYEFAIRKSLVLFSTLRQMLEERDLDIKKYGDLLTGVLNSGIFLDGSPLAVHFMMFLPAIMSQTDEEQLAIWLPRGFNLSIIGTYSQTELGHGTFIRGLETTATYDPRTKEFVLHSPTLTSYKWWPGGLGQTANYSIVVAQLYTKGQCYGTHSFMVQLRDEDTHQVLPGVKVGDIGAKLGVNAVNNGFLGFDNLRIPRNQMFMKHAQVLEDGTYVKSNSSKLKYGTMIFVRILIVRNMVMHLSMVVTIAVRYSAVRRQSQLKEGEPECQIMDFLTQQHKLYVSIATSHALRVTAAKLVQTYQTFNDQLVGGNLDRLPELHALACCLKAVSTADTASCTERCRLACGGHGYMMSSNLPQLYSVVTAACTYEGENTVLLLQTARYLVKVWQQIDLIQLTPTVAYLKRAGAKGYLDRWDNSVEGIIRGLQVVAMAKISSCVKNIEKRIAGGMSPEEAWNMTSVQLTDAAEIHCRVVIISTFHDETKRTAETAAAGVQSVLKQLDELYAVYWALEKFGDLVLYTCISAQDVDQLKLWYEDLLCKLRPNAVGLVDAFDIKDSALQSTLGAYDGRVYERLMEEAMKSPLNAEPVNQVFHQYLKPLMKGKL